MKHFLALFFSAILFLTSATHGFAHTLKTDGSVSPVVHTRPPEGEEEAAKVIEIIWTDGSIPADQLDDFYFNVKVPAKTTTLV